MKHTAYSHSLLDLNIPEYEGKTRMNPGKGDWGRPIRCNVVFKSFTQAPTVFYQRLQFAVALPNLGWAPLIKAPE